MMAWDRLRFVRNPNRLRLPAFVCCFGTWLTAMCLVMPYPLYIIYVDLGVSVADDNKGVQDEFSINCLGSVQNGHIYVI